jgi:hypothetical protein
MDDKYITPASSWAQCKDLSMKLYGKDCLFLSKSLCPARELGNFLTDPFNITPAHIFGRGAYPHMKLIPLNVVPLHLIIHSAIDRYINPITNCPMTKEERIEIWKLILGDLEETISEKKYELLEEINRRYYER